MKIIVSGRSERNDGERLIQIHKDIHTDVMFFDSEAIFFLLRIYIFYGVLLLIQKLGGLFHLYLGYFEQK